ncbi:AP-3 complex subunit sigma [Gossypium hirsutum]|uniref:AP-3 complex subunit sigma n=1 Tax=Gossypium hirsutum TaxID=3635 RepID=A0ABM2ZS68_GOSHI|nr:AP-3 complex subunit sigma-like [Gossypium hirsutum]
MIKAVMVMNTQGKPRLAKFFDYLPVEKQQELIRRVFGVLCSRPENIHTILDEIILGGQVLETRSTEIMRAVEEISKLEAATNAISFIPKSASSWLSR